MPYDPVNILSLQTWIQNSLGIDSVTAGFVTATLIIFLFFLPIMLLSAFYGKDHDSLMPYFMMVFGTLLMGFLTGIGWLPQFTWAILVFYIAFSMATMIRNRF